MRSLEKPSQQSGLHGPRPWGWPGPGVDSAWEVHVAGGWQEGVVGVWLGGHILWGLGSPPRVVGSC